MILNTRNQVYSEELPLATFPERVIAFQIETKQLRPERPQRLVEDTIWESIQLCWTHDATQRPKVEAVRHALKSYTSYARPEECEDTITPISNDYAHRRRFLTSSLSSVGIFLF